MPRLLYLRSSLSDIGGSVPNSSRHLLVIALVVLGVVWFWGLGHRPLFQTDEGRYAEIPREMLVSGNWVTPRLNGFRYFEKPPLQYWATAAAFAVFGINTYTARLWSALCSLIAVLFVGFAAGRLYTARVGWYSVGVLAASFYFLMLGHFNTLDASLACWMSVTLFSFLLALDAPPGSRSEVAWMLTSYGGAALAVLTKGLIGLLLPGAVLVLFLLFSRDWKLLRRLHLVRGLVLFLGLTLPWFVAVSWQNPDFLYQFFIAQEFLRFLTPISHRPGPPWYFVPILALAILPWWGSAVRALVEPFGGWLRRRRVERHTGLLWLWTVFIFVFFSISHSKLPSYILPIVPALAVLIAAQLARRDKLPVAPGVISSLVGIVGLVALPLGLRMESHSPLLLYYRHWLPWVEGAMALLLAVGLMGLTWRRRVVVSVAIITLGWLVAARAMEYGAAALGPVYSTRALVQRVARYEREETPIYMVGGYQQTLPFYLGRTVTLVAYQGEMAFGIHHARHGLEGRYVPTLKEFAVRWQAEPHALAFLPKSYMSRLRALGISFKVVSANPRWVAVVHA